MNKLTIIMYHYVRNLRKSKYPNINGIEINFFKKQLNFIQKKFTIISYDKIQAALLNNTNLPKNACWLTFDDGFADHYLNVFPELKKRKITAGFFPPAKAVEKREMLDVHKIHFIMASQKSNKIIEEIKIYLSKQKFVKYWKIFAKSDNLNSKEDAFIKKILQKGLKNSLRKKIVNKLFLKYVTSDEKSFADNLYVNLDQAREMISERMYFGSHGYDHLWLNQHNKSTQEKRNK